MKLADWIHDDITWCMSQCNNAECFRNPVNRRQAKGLFSAAYLENTDLCPKHKTTTEENNAKRRE